MGSLFYFLPDPTPPDAANLVDAVVKWLKGTPEVLAALPGGIWGDEATPAAVFPYADIGEPEALREYQSKADGSGTPCDDRITLTVTVYATGKAAAHDAARLVGAALHDAPLTFSGGELLYLRATNLAVTKDPDKAGGRDVWAAALSVSAIVSSTA